MCLPFLATSTAESTDGHAGPPLRETSDHQKTLSEERIVMKTSLNVVVLGLCVALLSSCTPAVKQTPVAPPSTVAVDYPANLQGAKLYRLSAEQSMLHILVYRGGAMAHLGHNHVISSQSVAGYVWLHDEWSRSGFNLTQAVNDLIVDDAQSRLDEGADFQTVVSDSARAGTKVNMLKPEQLDGEHFPVLRLHSVAITGERTQPTVHARITIKDQARDVTLPVQLTTDKEMLRAKGQFRIKLTDFGITPYSVAMGALKVEDELMIKFELTATRFAP